MIPAAPRSWKHWSKLTAAEQRERVTELHDFLADLSWSRQLAVAAESRKTDRVLSLVGIRRRAA